MFVKIQAIKLWNELQEKMHNVSLISLSTTFLKVDEKTYRICSAICHHGESLHHGHYTSLIKKIKSLVQM